MTVTYLGSLTVGDANPGAVAISAAGAAGINGALPDIQARLAALLAWTPSPVSFEAQLTLVQGALASIQASIALGLPVPDIGAQVALIQAQIAALIAAIAAVEAQLAIILDFQALFGASGVHAYAYAGQVANLGSEISAETSGGLPGGSGTDSANAIVLVTTVPATWTALAQLLKVTP